jgi:hypothetical protein
VDRETVDVGDTAKALYPLSAEREGVASYRGTVLSYLMSG